MKQSVLKCKVKLVAGIVIYRNRHAEEKLLRLASFFKVVLVTGARQTGKTTLLSHVFPDLKKIVFDPVQDLYNARRDPDLFLDNFPPPLILDEIQFAPELLPAVKRRVDQSEKAGQYLLTGSQNMSVLKSVSESMAGRVGILEIGTLSLSEQAGLSENKPWLECFLTNPENLMRQGKTPANSSALFHSVWKGGFPGLLEANDEIVPDFFSSYVQTYVQRDVRNMENIRELDLFGRFFSLLSSLSAKEINASQLGREIGISPVTSRKWLDLLKHSFQWKEVAPFYGNTIKRLSGRHRGYLCDSGMCCYLQRISGTQSLAANPGLGFLFETMMVNDIMCQAVEMKTAPHFYHWRTSGGAEVDLLLEYDGMFFPIEFKCKTNIGLHDIRGLRSFRETYPENKIKTALLIYAGKECFMLDKNTIAMPWNWVLEK